MTELIYHGGGERIDTWLTTQFPYSRNFFHHIIERWGIKVGKTQQKIIKKSYKLWEGEVVFIDDVTRFLSSVILDEAPNIDIPIVLEKEDYLVINKPKWILSHPNSVWDVGQPSVVWFLYHRYKNLPSIGNFIRAGLLHRLDKETDGLMLVAKTEKGLAHFKKLFQEKSEAETIEDKEAGHLKKFYRAVCYITDEWKKFLDQIKTFPYYIKELVIAKVPHNEPKIWITKIMAISSPVGSSTAYRVPRTEKIWWLVELTLEILTWRTHQIRYHLSHHGLPIVGDYVYGKDPDVSGPMWLTAWKLIFQDLDGKMVELQLLPN